MRFQLFVQQDKMDCGAACLRMMIAYYGGKSHLRDLHRISNTNKIGSSLRNLYDASIVAGFKAKAVKASWCELSTLALLPCIIHWNHNHFVIVYEIKKRWGKHVVCIADPACPSVLEYKLDDFLEHWLKGYDENENNSSRKGIVLMLEPAKSFSFDEKKEPAQSFKKIIGHYLRSYWKYFLLIVLALLATSLINLIIPFTTQLLVDKGIGQSNVSLLRVILVFQFCLICGQMTIQLSQSWLMLHLTTRISISFVSDFIAKLMRLPMSFYDSKKLGDIIMRIQDTSRIQSFLTETLLSMLLSLLTFVVYGFMIGGYKSEILVTFLVGGSLYVVWVLFFLKVRKKLDYQKFQCASENQSTVVQLINSMQDIKLNGCEDEKRWGWEKVQVKLFSVSIKSLNLQQLQGIGGMFIDQSKNLMISYLAARYIITGEMTLGMMTSLSYIVGQLNVPLQRLILFIQEVQDSKISSDRLNDIYCMPDEETNESGIDMIPKDASIEMNNVSFSYGNNNSKPILSNISIRIPPNRITAIVGSSGSGKTTLIKLLLGFYKPSNGIITLSGKNLIDFKLDSWRKACGAVMQDSYLFNDTIRNNIIIVDNNYSQGRFDYAVRMATVDDFIDRLPLGYDTKVGNEGHPLSSGQKQRILIARAIYKDCNYLFLDEATNSLDSTNELIIHNNITNLSQRKTIVIVAHRLSTVKNADNIVVIKDGTVVEQGTHDELIKSKGNYYQLVHDQIDMNC